MYACVRITRQFDPSRGVPRRLDPEHVGAGAAPLGAICRGTGCACRRLRPRRSTSLICHYVLRDVPLGKRADLQATIAQIERV